MSEIIEINTRDSVYEPIRIRLDGGKIFIIKKLDRETTRRLGEFDKILTEEKDTEAAYEKLVFLLGQETKKAVARIDFRQMPDILAQINRQITNSERKDKKEDDPGKNLTSPGDKESKESL